MDQQLRAFVPRMPGRDNAADRASACWLRASEPKPGHDPNGTAARATSVSGFGICLQRAPAGAGGPSTAGPGRRADCTGTSRPVGNQRVMHVTTTWRTLGARSRSSASTRGSWSCPTVMGRARRGASGRDATRRSGSPRRPQPRRLGSGGHRGGPGRPGCRRRSHQRLPRVCLPGGMALNSKSKANGQLLASDAVDDVFVKRAATDDGTAVGAAIAAHAALDVPCPSTL